MSNNTVSNIDLIQGKTVEFTEVQIQFCYGRTFLKASMVINDYVFHLECYNVQQIKLETLSCNFIVQGLEIIDKSKFGWQKENRYHIHDFEDNLLELYCEDIMLTLIE